jgi:mono/diheme cytochrome c family protein
MNRTLVALAAFAVFAGPVWAADGAAIYEKKCKVCHSIAGAGGPMAKTGGALDDAGSKHDEAWLQAYLKDPKSKMPTAKMPKVSLSDDEFSAVVAYMLTLKGK